MEPDIDELIFIGLISKTVTSASVREYCILLFCWALVVDGVVIVGEQYSRVAYDLAEQIPYLYSPHFAIANLDPSNIHGLSVTIKVFSFFLFYMLFAYF